jgi:hypothetical protein
VERFVYGSHDAIDFGEDFVVPEPKHAIALRIEVGASFGVGSRLRGLGVVASVNFNDQFMPMAGEISEKSSDGRLAAKVSAV